MGNKPEGRIYKPEKVVFVFDENEIKQLLDLMVLVKELINLLEKSLDDIRKDDEA